MNRSLLAWIGRLSFRQYITKKEHKYGIKYFELTTSGRLILRICIYTAERFEDPEGLRQSGATVLQLMRDFVHQGYQVFMDNWYNSVKLVKSLSEIATYVCGTLNPRQLRRPKKLIGLKLKKNELV